jgi:long-chain fatty acid transport protein
MQRIVRFALGLLLGVPAALAAQGFGVYEHGTCTMGRSGTAAARPCDDGSAIFFNPAGLAGMSGTHLSAGVTLIGGFGSFTDDASGATWDLDNPLIPVPSFYVTRTLNPKLTVGLGVFAPYGLETKWPTGDFPGRFLGWNSRLASIYIQPSVGYQLHPRLKLGFGAAFVTSEVELKQRLDFSEQVVPSPAVPPGTRFKALGIPSYTDFAEAHLTANGTGWAFNIGAIVKVSDRLSIGGHYLTRASIDYEGDAVFDSIPTGLILPAGNPLTGVATPVDALTFPLFAPGAPLGDGGAKTTITMPNQFTLGLAWQMTDKWAWLFDYQMVVWGWFQSLTLDFDNAASPDLTLYEGYNDTHGFRLGTEYAYNASITLRGGYLYHTGAAPPETVTPLLPEGARNEATVGLGWKVTPKLTADFGYQFIRQNDRRGRVHDPAIGNTGLYEFGGHLFGVGLAYTF